MPKCPPPNQNREPQSTSLIIETCGSIIKLTKIRDTYHQHLSGNQAHWCVQTCFINNHPSSTTLKGHQMLVDMTNISKSQ